ncbi:MAG: hypothetical protein IT241_04780, partial [Bacteroidia bacterium]|nr:hypothetical protein [Bacteroidia bacterium]
ITYKTIKVRGLLLHVKALLTDLHFLNINSGEFYNSVINLITVRNNWFNHRPSDQSLKAIILEFYQLFKGFLIEIFQHYTFYVPDQPPVQLSAAIRLSHSEKTTFRHSGILLPQFILSVIKKGISLQNRLNKFTFAIPLQSNDYPDIILQRFNYLREGIIYNRQHLPGFLCTAYPLNFFKLNR